MCATGERPREVAYIPYYTFVPILLQSMRAYDVTEGPACRFS